MVSKQIEELRKYARKWSEWNGFNAAMPVLPSTNIQLLRSAADTIEALSAKVRAADRPTGECRTCGRNADNGGVHEDGRTKCPIQEHYALLLDGYCHLYEPYDCGVKMLDMDYQRAIEQVERDMTYEPTYNSEDGSL